MQASARADEAFGLNGWDLLRLALLSSPVGALLLLLRHPSLDPQIQVPGFHFGIVTLAAGAAALVAFAVLASAEQLRDPRAFFLGLSFCSIAGFFFIHGLLTPGVIFTETSNGIGWAPPLSLFLGALCLALSTVRERSDGDPWVFAHRKTVAGILFALWLGFLVLSIAVPRFLEGHPTSIAGLHLTGHDPHAHDDHDLSYERYGSHDYGSGAHDSADADDSDGGAMADRPWLSGIVLLTTLTLFLFSALRYGRLYRLSRLPLHATVVAGVALLMESLLSLYFASVWRVSWWEYHVLVLLGVTTILYGMVLHYRRGASLPRTISALLLKGSIEALEQSYSEVLTGLIAAVEARDPYTKGHSEKVARMAARIGEQLGLQPERLRALHQAGLIHDIGKIGIPDSILSKPGRLTPEEMAVVKEHPVRSEEMIGRIPSLRPTLRAIRWHHERLDGSGYPDGLVGDDIPFDARILAVADVFDAMTSGRSYRTAWPDHVALSHLTQEAGQLYDSRCVQAILEIVRGRTEESRAGVPQPLLTKP